MESSTTWLSLWLTWNFQRIAAPWQQRELWWMVIRCRWSSTVADWLWALLCAGQACSLRIKGTRSRYEHPNCSQFCGSFFLVVCPDSKIRLFFFIWCLIIDIYEKNEANKLVWLLVWSAHFQSKRSISWFWYGETDGARKWCRFHI